MVEAETIGSDRRRTWIMDRIRGLFGTGRTVKYGKEDGRDSERYWFCIQYKAKRFKLGCDTAYDLREVSRLFAVIMQLNNDDFDQTARDILNHMATFARAEGD